MSNKYHDKVYASLCSEKTLQSNERGFFMQFFERVEENAGSDWIENVFGKLKTDKERIRAIYEYEPTCTVISSILFHVQEIYRKKSAEVSQARRTDAENAMCNRNYTKALIFFSQSVLRAPPTGENPKVDSGNTLALALWGRSEALMALNEYSLALVDIQFSLKEGLPSLLKADAFWRTGICYKAQGETDRAKVAFGIAEKLIPPDRIKALRNDMEKEFKEKIHLNRRVLPSVTGKRHPDFPDASNSISIREAPGFGRYAIANDHIKTGATIAVEAPYAACLVPESFGTNCHHCFDRLIAPVGCTTCSNVAFCKIECRDLALSSYHKYECKFLDLLIGSGMSILSHTALRMITQNTLWKCLDVYANRKLEKVYSLCTNATMRSPRDFLQRTLMAAFLLKCLTLGEYFATGDRETPNQDQICIGDKPTPSQDQFCIGELLLFHLQMLQFNAHEIYETRHGPNHRLRGSKAAYIGVAVYPTVALFNHDCYPSVTRYFVGKKIVINAVRPMAPGELIAENYGPVFTRKTLPQRQHSLSGRYWFNCQCAACKQDWPSFETGLENVSRRVRCPNQKCKNFFTLPISNETLKCPKCKKKVHLTENVFKMKMCETALKQAVDALEAQEPIRGIEMLTKAIDVFHSVSVPPHMDLHLGQEMLRSFLADSGNVYECLTSSADN